MNEEKIYTMTLYDGTVIENLGWDGLKYHTKYELPKSLFHLNTKKVTIACGDEVQELFDQELGTYRYDEEREEWRFTLRKKSEFELFKEHVVANMDYLAMEAGVEL